MSALLEPFYPCLSCYCYVLLCNYVLYEVSGAFLVREALTAVLRYIH